MNIRFANEEEQGGRFLLDDYCAYCGESLSDMTEENKEWVEKGFCTKDCINMFHAEDELADEPDYFDEDRAELDALIRDEMKTRDGRLPMFRGEEP